MRISTWLCGVMGGVLLLAMACAPVEGPATPAGPDSGPDRLPTPAVDDAKPVAKTLPEVPGGLKQRIEAAVRNVRKRDLLTTNAFWTIFHGILGLGPGVELYDPETKQRVNALDYICRGGKLRGLVFKPTFTGVEVVSTQDTIGQGHQDQFISEMAQWGMPADRKIVVNDRTYTFLDFVKHSQARASITSNQELSWTIMVVAQYLDVNKPWVNLQNEKLTFEQIVQYELNAPIENAACGGTHRLFGLSWVYHLHLQKGGKTEGIYKAIQEKTVRYRNIARETQNSDGTFSTSYLAGRANDPDKNRRINTTGHVLEWLALALSDEELRQQWVQDAVNALSLLILEMQGTAIDAGAMYHAVHGLLIYHARVFDRSFCPKELLVPLPPGWKQI